MSFVLDFALQVPTFRLVFQNQIYWYTNSSNGILNLSISIIDHRKDELE